MQTNVGLLVCVFFHFYQLFTIFFAIFINTSKTSGNQICAISTNFSSLSLYIRWKEETWLNIKRFSCSRKQKNMGYNVCYFDTETKRKRKYVENLKISCSFFENSQNRVLVDDWSFEWMCRFFIFIYSSSAEHRLYSN